MRKNHTHNVKNQEPIVAEELRQLSRLFVLTEKFRNKHQNLRNSKIPFLTDEKWLGEFELQKKRGKEHEHEIKKSIETLVNQHPWGEYLMSIRGVGPVIAGGIIGELCGDIYASIDKGNIKEGGKLPKPALIGHGPRTFERTSDLWAYAGYGVRDGKAAKRTTGEASSWNKYLKLLCYKFAENQIKQGTDYRKIYDERKAYEQTMHPELSKAHIHNRATRYMIKKFLSNIKHDLLS